MPNNVEGLFRGAEPRRIAILGVTGSVGANTLDLVRRHPAAFQVEAVTAHNNVAGLAEAARAVGARFAAIGNPERYVELKEALAGTGIEAAAGASAVTEAAERPADWVMAAIVGAAGLEPSLAAIRRGATLALANKETLVCAGALMMAEVKRHGATVLPVDSEHNAIFQVIDFDHLDTVERVILTASGGPFRTFAKADLRAVTREQAVAHPNWSMGAKISVDSATMMNKGLEFIEAHHLFGLPPSRIEVLVHPQSIVHSLVAYRDGSVLAQLGTPDMRTPIAHTLAWPTRMHAPVQPLDLAAIGQLSFEAPDEDRFPALRLAREALQTAGAAPTILNAANEVAVGAFLEERIGFLDIAGIVEAALSELGVQPVTSIEDIGIVDAAARDAAGRRVERISA
ncbi:1-deoxy-D-xylulose-5-phosphate reductoisomerase [Ferruginivarius sediminum]|uniref:1-deoxy-D-xylulose 5-phosphate reductoisomerase n=1 Tax=Ferruginivarius sediminum TaxID=2661937 RepID=A0A369TA38_9PROT|nr:1-deoxy-D-xylulose-5-phosphate reductoisomerase [Ferruginivarius sediminum]RDD62183.1 1-deoxy-D-xylulose-5-phosphate reductoisomerase [Ferruginivarius sediminum]